MNARKQPNTIMAMVIQMVELSWALNNFGDRAKCCPAKKGGIINLSLLK